ncbi:CD63 antigen-like [Limulus polyphemus]|uniref:Tetraspanin n=1 Tax=Limulus polyphemus TaxID=6850 RepID=A0ABM1C5J9_LIMPO|nr:CD63 antigen-like [Limulus polyphemus]
MGTVQGAMAIIKYLLFAFNFIFVIMGIVLISIGAVVKIKASEYLDFIPSKFASPPTLIIVVGVIVFIIAFLGCCGAIKENHCMVMTFGVLISLIFILEISAGIAAYVYRSQLKDFTRTQMKESLKHYNASGHGGVKNTWDAMQKKLHCCGAVNTTDWNDIFTGTLPTSCCENQESNCTDTSSDLYTTPCADALTKIMKQKAGAVGGAAVGIAFVEIIGVVLSCCLAHTIKKGYEVM